MNFYRNVFLLKLFCCLQTASGGASIGLWNREQSPMVFLLPYISRISFNFHQFLRLIGHNLSPKSRDTLSQWVRQSPNHQALLGVFMLKCATFLIWEYSKCQNEKNGRKI